MAGAADGAAKCSIRAFATRGDWCSPALQPRPPRRSTETHERCGETDPFGSPEAFLSMRAKPQEEVGRIGETSAGKKPRETLLNCRRSREHAAGPGSGQRIGEYLKH